MARKRKNTRTRLDADRGLAPENFAGLNEAFYRASPHGFLHQRWFNLLLVRAKGEQFDAMAAEGIEIEGVKYRTGSDNWAMDPDERQAFVIVETEVLLHHVSETLLRLYLAHLDLPPCPWLELARVRDFRAFKKSVARLQKDLTSDTALDRLRAVFYGSDRRAAFTPEPPDELWVAGAKNIAGYLAAYATIFLGAASYNAAKHGLVMNAGQTSMRVDDGTMISAEGPSLSYLTIRDQAGQRKWVQETKWVDLNRSAALTWVGCLLLAALWAVGRGRYLGERPQQINFFDRPRLDEVEAAAREGQGPIAVERLARSLSYYKLDE